MEIFVGGNPCLPCLGTMCCLCMKHPSFHSTCEWFGLGWTAVSIGSRDLPAVLGRLVFLMTNVLDRSTIVGFLRFDEDAGVGEKFTSSLAASFLAEGIAHPQGVGASAPHGVLPEEYRTQRLQPAGYQGRSLLEIAVKYSRSMLVPWAERSAWNKGLLPVLVKSTSASADMSLQCVSITAGYHHIDKLKQPINASHVWRWVDQPSLCEKFLVLLRCKTKNTYRWPRPSTRHGCLVASEDEAPRFQALFLAGSFSHAHDLVLRLQKDSSATGSRTPHRS